MVAVVAATATARARAHTRARTTVGVAEGTKQVRRNVFNVLVSPVIKVLNLC